MHNSLKKPGPVHIRPRPLPWVVSARHQQRQSFRHRKPQHYNRSTKLTKHLIIKDHGEMSDLKYTVYPSFGEYARENLGYSQAVRVDDRIECSGQGEPMSSSAGEQY